jgi:hypothetical protein
MLGGVYPVYNAPLAQLEGLSNFALLAQRIERLASDQKVGGSIPSERTKISASRTDRSRVLVMAGALCAGYTEFLVRILTRMQNIAKKTTSR